MWIRPYDGVRTMWRKAGQPVGPAVVDGALKDIALFNRSGCNKLTAANQHVLTDNESGFSTGCLVKNVAIRLNSN